MGKGFNMSYKELLTEQLKYEKDGEIVVHSEQIQRQHAVTVILKFNNTLRTDDEQSNIGFIYDNEIVDLVNNNGLNLDKKHFIIYTGNHFYVASFKKNINNKLDVFIIDAVNSKAQNYFVSLLSSFDLVATVFKINEKEEFNLQKSGFGCLVFSLYHAYKLINLDIISLLIANENLSSNRENKKLFEYSWNQLPPELIRICQSNSFWSQYKLDNPGLDFDLHDAYRKRMKEKVDDNEFPGNIIPAIREEYILPVYKLVAKKNESYITKLIFDKKFKVSPHDAILLTATKASLTTQQFKVLYNHTYRTQFFKNPNSEMRKRLSGDPNIREIIRYGEINSNTRTGNILKQFA